MTDRLISVNALLKELEENAPSNWTYSESAIQEAYVCSKFVDMVKRQPSIDPDSLKPKGRWIPYLLENDHREGRKGCWFRCSECGSGGWILRYKDCPDCGAKMDKEETE